MITSAGRINYRKENDTNMNSDSIRDKLEEHKSPWIVTEGKKYMKWPKHHGKDIAYSIQHGTAYAVADGSHYNGHGTAS